MLLVTFDILFGKHAVPRLLQINPALLRAEEFMLYFHLLSQLLLHLYELDVTVGLVAWLPSKLVLRSRSLFLFVSGIMTFMLTVAC